MGMDIQPESQITLGQFHNSAADQCELSIFINEKGSLGERLELTAVQTIIDADKYTEWEENNSQRMTLQFCG